MFHSYKSILYNLRILGVEPHQEISGQHHDTAKHCSHEHSLKHSYAKCLSAPLFLSCAIVLADKCNRSLSICRYDKICEILKIQSRGRSSYRIRSKTVDSSLYKNIRKREHRCLYRGWCTYPEYLSQAHFIYSYILHIESERSFLVHQYVHNYSCADHIGYDRCHTYTCDSKLAHAHKEQIENNIEHTRYYQTVERSSRISYRSEHCSSKVIKYDKRHAHKVYPQI